MFVCVATANGDGARRCDVRMMVDCNELCLVMLYLADDVLRLLQERRSE